MTKTEGIPGSIYVLNDIGVVAQSSLGDGKTFLPENILQLKLLKLNKALDSSLSYGTSRHLPYGITQC